MSVDNNEIPAYWPRHPIAWSDIAGRSVAIWGLGVEGTANLREALRNGAQVTIVDRSFDSADVAVLPADLASQVDPGACTADEQRLFDVDIVVKSPGISRYRSLVRQLVAAGVTVVGGHGLWLQGADPNTVALVTGTKGKSTTVSIVGHFFTSLGLDGAIGGNLGRPPYGSREPATATWWVIELSSYQACDIATRPKVVALSSLSPDHTEWHLGQANYYRDKTSLASLPPADGVDGAVVLANQSGGDLAGYVSEKSMDIRLVGPDDRARRVAQAMGLIGEHNAANAALALAILDELLGETFGAFSEEALCAAARGYEPLQSRMTLVGSIDGVDFIDDCLATNTLPTIAALSSLGERPVALLLGGHSRGIDYGPIAEHFAATDQEVLVLCTDAPDNGAYLAELITAAGPASGVTVRVTTDLAQSVGEGFAWARSRGGAVLLSPAAPTRGQEDDGGTPGFFPNYVAKSERFLALVNDLDVATT